MQTLFSRIPLVLTAVILLGAACLLHSDVEYCGQPEALRPHGHVVADASQSPTLAPPQKIVFLQVDAEADLEIHWE